MNLFLLVLSKYIRKIRNNINMATQTKKTSTKSRNFKQERKTQLKREGREGERKRAQAQRNAKKSGIRKTGDGADSGHKRSAKNGGSPKSSNLKKQSRSSNRSDGGKSGSRAGKAAGGAKSSRKGIKNK